MGRLILEKSREILKTFFQTSESSTQNVCNQRNKFDINIVSAMQFEDQFVIPCPYWKN